MRKKENASSNIAFIGMMTALNAVFVLVSRFLPLSAFILMIALPLTTVLVTMFCQKKYIAIYAVASLIICIAINPSDGIYYVTSSICSGLVFGVCIRNKLHPYWGLLLASVAATAINFATLPLVKLILGISIEETFGIVFKVNQASLRYAFCLFIVCSSIFQTIFSSLIVNNEIKKYLTDLPIEPPYLIFSIASVVLGLFSIGISFVSPSISFVALGFCCLACAPSNKLLVKKKLSWCYAIALFLQLALFAIFYQIMGFPQGLTLFNIVPIILSTIGIIVTLVNNHRNKLPNEEKIL